MRAPLWLVERACTRKRVYTTKAQAKQAKQAMAAKAQRPFTIYQCPHCGWWHLATRRH